MYIKQESKEAVIETAQIEEIIATFVTLKKHGASYRVENNRSLSVSPAKQIYKDFATDEGGDVITYLMKQQSMTFKDALEYIASYYKIELEYEKDTKLVETDLHRESLIACLATAKEYFFNTLKGSQEAIEYLVNRGITQESIQHFGLGYANAQWSGLLDYAGKYHNANMLKEAFLIAENQEKNKLYDRYRDRITFALHNKLGEIIGFSGRTLKKEKDVAKYINPSDNELLYQKSKFIYGLHQAQHSIRKHNRAYIVEGYVDVILFAQLGITNTISLSGLSLSEYQTKILQKICKVVVLCLDSDKAGEDGATRNIEKLLRAGFEVRVVTFEEGEDPASLCTKLINEDTESAPQNLETYLKKVETTFLQYTIGSYERSILNKEALNHLKELELAQKKLEAKYQQNQETVDNTRSELDLLKDELPLIREDFPEKYEESREKYSQGLGTIKDLIVEQKVLKTNIQAMKLAVKVAEHEASQVYEDAIQRAEFMNKVAKMICTIPEQMAREVFKKEASAKFPELKKFKWAEEERKNQPEEQEERAEIDTSNIIYMLRRYIDRNYKLRISVIDNELQVKSKNPKFTSNIDALKAITTKNYTPLDETALLIDLMEKGYNMPEKTLTMYLKVATERFNIFQEYFEGLKCDGDIGYFNDFYKSFNMQEHDIKRFATLFPNWLARVVATSIDDYFYNKQCLMFIGGQHIGKSALCNWFIPKPLEKYQTSYIDIGNKDSIIAICENMYINLDEFDKYSPKEVAAMKAYMAISSTKVRPPFEKKAIPVTRRSSFIGNTNQTTFLRDIQGGSVRWLCFPLQGAMKWEKFNKIDKERMYALAYMQYKEAVGAGSWSGIEMSHEQIRENDDENRKYAEYTDEMYYLTRHYKPFPKDSITDDELEAGSVIFLNATEVCMALERYYDETEKRTIRLDRRKMGEALHFFKFQQDKFRKFIKDGRSNDIYRYALHQYPDPNNIHPEGHN